MGIRRVSHDVREALGEGRTDFAVQGGTGCFQGVRLDFVLVKDVRHSRSAVFQRRPAFFAAPAVQ